MLRMAVVTEDIRPPLDEGIRKASFLIIRSLEKVSMDLCVYTRFGNPLVGSTRPLPDNKFLWGPEFFEEINRQHPNLVLYIPASSGTIGAFIRMMVLRQQMTGSTMGMLSLQYRKLPTTARLLGLNRSADVVFTHSSASQKVLQSLGCNTVLLPGGVDTGTFHPVSAAEKQRLREKYGFSGDCPVVLHVGHLTENRKVTDLIRLAEAGYRVVLISGTTTTADPEILTALEGAGVVVIRQYIENIEHFYQLCDCYFFPVVHAYGAIDAPLSILEAMACNCPVVTTPYGALPGMFNPGQGLYYFESEEEMVPLVGKAIQNNHTKTQEMIAPYSWDNLAMIILQTLQKLGSPEMKSKLAGVDLGWKARV